MSFQSRVKTQQAIGVAGDWASANPRYSAIAGPGGFVAGPKGVFIGRFAWGAPPVDQDGTDQVINSFGSGQPMGFIHRDQQGLNTVFLSEASMLIPEGFMVTVMSSGEFLAVNDGDTDCLVGMKAYANYADGKASFGASGSPGTASATGSIAAATNSFTGSIEDDVLTVAAGGITGTIVPGTKISGTGIPANCFIVSQESGTPGADGTYLVSIPELDVASTAITGTYGIFTAASGLTGEFGIGDTLSGTNVVAGTTITALGTGTGGLGTYIVNNNTVVTSTAITAGTSIETKWYAASAGGPGDLIKITPITQGF